MIYFLFLVFVLLWAKNVLLILYLLNPDVYIIRNKKVFPFLLLAFKKFFGVKQ